MQERLGEVPAHDGLRSSRNDQHLSNDAKQTGSQTEMAGDH